MRLPNKKDLLSILAAGIISISGAFMSGCGDPFQTKAIKDKTKEIIEMAGEDVAEKYKRESGIDFEIHPERKEVPILTVNPDKTYTFFYTAEFTDPATLEKIVKEQIKDAGVSTNPDINRLIINLKNESQISYLEELLDNSDRLPQQVSLEFSAFYDYGDQARDIASQMDLTISSQGREFGAITGQSNLPGAADRVKARSSMGTRTGIELESDAVKMIAIVDYLNTHGYLKQLFKTNVVLLNGRKNTVGGNEKLPIKNYVLAGQNVVQTYTLEDVKSMFEGTGLIHEDMVNLKYSASVGNAKRPEARVDFLVPVHDEVSSEGVILKIGALPLLVAGKLNHMTIGRTKESWTPWPVGVDSQETVVRIWYMLNLRRITQWDYSPLTKSKPQIRVLESKLTIPVTDPNSRYRYDPNSLVRPILPVTDPNSKDKPNARLSDKYMGIAPSILKYLTKEAA